MSTVALSPDTATAVMEALSAPGYVAAFSTAGRAGRPPALGRRAAVAARFGAAVLAAMSAGAPPTPAELAELAARAFADEGHPLPGAEKEGAE